MGTFNNGKRDGERGDSKYKPPRGFWQFAADMLNPILPEKEMRRRNQVDASYNAGFKKGRENRKRRGR